MIKEHGTILIPIDFSKQSLIGIKNAYTIGKSSHSKLMILQVYSKPEEENKVELEQLAKQTSLESGLICDFATVKGDLFIETDKIAEKIGATLILVGLAPLVKFRSFMGSSSASKFIKNAPCPVLTTRVLIKDDGFKNILMPFDLSPESREKVGTVIQMSKYFNTEVRIVSVFDPNDSKYENQMLPYLQQVKKYMKDRGVHCTNKSIPSKDPVQSIIEYGNKNECGLIIQMNKRDLNISELFSGTSSQKIVDLSSIPVLTINPMIRESISSGIH